MIRRSRLHAAVLLIAATVLAGCGLNARSTPEEVAQARWIDVQTQFSGRARLTSDIVGALRPLAEPQDGPALQSIASRAAGAIPTPPTPTDAAAFRRYQAAQQQLSGALVQLDQISARYPVTRTDRTFILLNTRLDGAEGRIAVAVNDYNKAAGDHNEALGRFPASLWSGDRRRMQLFRPGTT